MIISIPKRRRETAFAMPAVCIALILLGVLGLGWSLRTPARAASQPKAVSAHASTWHTKNIEDVRAGDWVLSRDEHSTEASPLIARRVETAFTRTVYSLRVLSVRDEKGELQELKTTDEHPFWVVGKGWVEAGALKAGDPLIGANGEAMSVAGTTVEPRAEGVTVYNFKVPGAHTYFVRAANATGPPVWVHNADCNLGYLTVAEFEALPAQGTISPWRIRSSQNTASWNFKPPFQNSSIGEAAYQLRKGQKVPQQFGAVKLVEKDGMIWSVDNRRVLTFRSAGMDIPYEKTTWDALTPAQKSHFTSTTDGESIIILMPNQ